MRTFLLVLLLSQPATVALANDPLWEEIHGNGQYTVTEYSQADRRLRAIERDFERDGMVGMAERANTALRGLMKIAVLNLKRQGHYDTAKEVERGWRAMDGDIISLVSDNDRKITDFEPWSQSLAILYIAISAKLSPTLMTILRLHDIATYAWTPTVVFSPCRFGKTEFLLHFAASDSQIGSFAPVTSFWLTNVGCSIGTFSAGIYWLCSPLAMLVELGMENAVAPRLGNWIYDRVCQ